MQTSKVLVAVVAILAIQSQMAEANFLLGYMNKWNALLGQGQQQAYGAVVPPVTTTSPAPRPSPAPARSPTPSTTTYPNVAAAAIANPQLSTLVSVASAVGLAQALSDPNLVATVLAPNNAAFAALLSRLGLTEDQLLANQELVMQVLSYHLIPGQALRASQLTNGQTLTTALDGQTLRVVKQGNAVQFDPSGPGAPNARVVTADIQAGQAIVHVIDQVLIPAGLTGLPSAAAPSPAPQQQQAGAATAGAGATTAGGAGTATTTTTGAGLLGTGTATSGGMAATTGGTAAGGGGVTGYQGP